MKFAIILLILISSAILAVLGRRLRKSARKNKCREALEPWISCDDIKNKSECERSYKRDGGSGKYPCYWSSGYCYLKPNAKC